MVSAVHLVRFQFNMVSLSYLYICYPSSVAPPYFRVNALLKRWPFSLVAKAVFRRDLAPIGEEEYGARRTSGTPRCG